MPTPAPEPTAEQLVTVAEIALLTVDEVAAMVSSDSDQAISDAKWSRTLADIAEWADVGSDPGDIKKIDSIEFFQGAAVKGRLEFRNTLRQRYGYAPLLTENSAETNFSVRSLCWF